MGFPINMDFSNVEPNQGGRTYLPVSDSRGWLVQITESSQQENNKKNGLVAKFVIQGMEGAATGMTTEHYVNLTNPEPKAVNIGMGELSAIGHVLGHVRPANSQEWHGKPLRAVVVADPSDQYPNATKILKFLDANGNPPTKGGQQPQNGGGNFGGGQPAGNFGGAPQGGQPAGGGFNAGGAPAGGGAPQGGGFQPAGAGFQPNAGQQPQNGGQPQGGGFQPGNTGGAGPGWG